MTNSPNRRVDVVVVWAWTVMLALVALGIFVMVDPAGWRTSDKAAQMLVVLVPTVMGALLRTKVPENPIWSVFILAGLGALLAITVSTVVESGPPTDPTFWDYVSTWFSLGLSSLSFFYPYLLILYLFPTGRFLNRRWRWAGWYILVAGPTVALTAAFQTHIGDPFADEPWTIPNPIGFIPTTVGDVVLGIAIWGLYIVALGSVVAIAVRFRRASAGERAQIKWLLFAGAVFVLGFFDVVFGVTIGTLIEGVPSMIGLVGIPVAITIAITRYRLFEIDRIISRTVSYLLVVGLLAVVFVVGAVWLPTQVFGEQSSLFVAGSTLAVAAIFNPVRKLVQRFVDRRFNRSAYVAGRRMARTRAASSSIPISQGRAEDLDVRRRGGGHGEEGESHDQSGAGD